MDRVKSILAFLILSAGFAHAILPIGIERQAITQANSASVIFGSNVVSGHLIVAVLNWNGGGSAPPISDTCGSGWPVPLANTAGGWNMFVWFAAAGCSGPDTISIGVSAAAQTLSATEFNTYTSTTDGTVGGSFTTVGAAFSTTGNFTTTTNGDLIVCAAGGTHFDSTLGAANDWFSSATPNHAGAHIVTFAIAGTANASNACGIWNNISDFIDVIGVAFKPPPGITITSATLPDGAATVPYKYQLQAIGGSGAYTWSIIGGALFTGMSMPGSGLIQGTPSTGGTASPITFHVTDGTNTKDVMLHLTIGGTLHTPALVQQISNSGGSVQLVFPGNVTAGNLLMVDIAGAGSEAFNGVNCVTDSVGTQYVIVQEGSFINNVTGSPGELVYRLAGIAPASGPNTVAWNGCGINLSNGGTIMEFSGLQLFHDVGNNASAPGQASLSVSLTTLVPNQMAIAAGWNAVQGVTVNANAPLTDISSPQNVTGIGAWDVGDDLAASAGTYTLGFNYTAGIGPITGMFVGANAYRPSLATPFTLSSSKRHGLAVY